MDTLTYIGIGLLCLGWLVLFIVSMVYRFKDDEQNKPYTRSLPKVDPDNPQKTDTPG